MLQRLSLRGGEGERGRKGDKERGRVGDDRGIINLTYRCITELFYKFEFNILNQPLIIMYPATNFS